MLDDLLELFERDRKPGTQPKSGLRGRLTSLLGDDDRERPTPTERDRRSDDRHADDDDDRRSDRKRSRDRELFEFGD